ncbi:tetrapyrrole methylase family protein / MazG family protein [Proteiniborus ethanoligenes]|uniref:Tetrapyrrole methylase family protein / MazG family protein n=1 Tax=Proteiniborus ethanoligenes TaxID=415015 RepID=A0A1H3KYG5_9FIRM|nr:nucleoside triphosphate pyrophosphohydrolase [Proteiniborus ethanoligenes]SDY57212.1 tetrapyrrole methylase family protein / MazG family protein [Proteiniborus ethanoligenes]
MKEKLSKLIVNMEVNMGKITVVGLGPGDVSSLTLGAIEIIGNGNKVFLRTEKHPTVEYLDQKGIEYNSYDYAYEIEASFEKVYEHITQDLVTKSQKHGHITYCVPGHPLVAEKTVAMLISLEKQGKIELEIVPGLSFIEPIILAVGHDPINGLKVIDGLNIKEISVDINIDCIITQVYDKMRASEVKLALAEIYGDEHEIYVISSAGIKKDEEIVKIPLYELDRVDNIGYLTSIYVPRVKDKSIYDIYDLIRIMEKLRGEEGCPWDAEQTHVSLREYIIEEAYEVVDAINNEDMDALADELGDLLLQVVFQSQIGKEEGYFNFWDVTTNICKKLIYRHPHVFLDKTADNVYEALKNWNDMKAEEKNIKTYTERLKDIPKSLPSLMRSYKVQQRAADVGFDWEHVNGAIEKLHEELNEVIQEIENNNKENLELEIGDLIFAIVNVSRFLNINPENAINKTIEKFVERFEFIETESKKMGKNLKEMSLEDMDFMWEKAKIHKNKKNDKK